MNAPHSRFTVARPRHRRRRALVAAVALAGVMGALHAVPAQAAPAGLRAQHMTSISGIAVAASPRPEDLSQGALSSAPPSVDWPTAATATADVASAAAVAPGGLTVRVAPEGVLATRRAPHGMIEGLDRSGPGVAGARVSVTVLDRADLPDAWRDAVVLRFGRLDATASVGVKVELDYSSVATALGADWSSRLRLLSLPECGLVTPQAPQCQPTPVQSTNDTSAMTLSGTLSVPAATPTEPTGPPSGSTVGGSTLARRPGPGGGALLVMSAGAGGPAGDYSATPLQASSSWTAGGSTGDFAWNYPIRTPPALGGPAPSLSLAYSSSSVDGRSETTNNQPSWVGEGFDYWPGYIERSYVSCASDKGNGANNTTDSGDQCWATDNAVLSLNGSSAELIRDTASGTWRLKRDDGSKVERLTNTVNADNDHEYWRVTTADGNQYYFGLNRLPGYTGTSPADKTTNAVWTVPVAGNHAGEPCHATGFVASFCDQAWRWNLDYVVDLHGNTMSLYYAAETNKYGRNNSASDAVTYTRGGTVLHIDYGTNNRGGVDTVNTSTTAPMRVTFTTEDRCLNGCETHDQAHWPDVPWDQECTATCTDKLTPTFWSTKRLATITTQVSNDDSYRDIERWTLTHNFPDPGDGTRAGLWLEAINHTGLVGGTAATPEINFDWLQLSNRVDNGTDGKPAMNWMRMATIWTESGGKISVRYSDPECAAPGHLPASPQTNTYRCYPVLEEQPDDSITTEYFHKYLVTSVTQADLTGGGPDVVTTYDYVGAPAWRHTDDDGLTKNNLRTWSDFRGYGQVDTRVGDTGGQTLTRTTFFRGMHGDLDGSGGTRSVTLPALDLNGDGDTVDLADAPAVADEDGFAGLTRQEQVLNGSVLVSATANQPWQSPPTATRTTTGTQVDARYQGVAASWVATALSSGGARVTRTNSSYDAFGMVNQSEDLGNAGVGGDEQCMKTTFNRNPAGNLTSLAGRVEVYALPCSASPQSADDVISDTRYSFDGGAYGVAPTVGETTRIEKAKSWTLAGGPVWLTTSVKVYDPYGREVDSTDLLGNHTVTAFTPATGGPVTRTTSTNARGWTSTLDLEPAWGSPVAQIDVNNRRTDLAYDPLGRLTSVWLPNHAKATYPGQPNVAYEYLLRNSGGVNAITTRRLNASGNYVTTYALLDGNMRARQTQSPSVANGNVGTVFSSTKYDAAGRIASISTHFDESVQASTTLYAIADWQPKNIKMRQYDLAGRQTAEILMSSGAEVSRTTTSYGGDRTLGQPPAGGTPTMLITDARGNVVEKRQYHSASDLGSDSRPTYDLTTFHRNGKGQLDWASDNAGNTWTYSYDLLGRQVATTDPDKGSSSAVYDDNGNLTSISDSRGQTVVTTYDDLGRRLAEYAGSTSGTKLASWTYDPPGARGYPATASRWVGGDEYKVKVRGYTPTYSSTGEDFTIPPSETGLAGTYTVTRSYKVDGSPATVTYPNVGGLGAETLTYTYDPVSGMPEQLRTNLPGAGQYVSNTDYTAYGETSFIQFGLTSGSWLQRSFTYDETTHALTRAQTVRETSPHLVSDVTTTYNLVGGVSKIVDASAGAATDTQCFAYDWVQRLTGAWTPASGDCAASADESALGGPAPYWQSWTFDAAGSRASATHHVPGTDTVSLYAYATPGLSQPHAVQSVTTTSASGTSIASYGYDSTGNTTARPGPSAAQTLSWDAEGKLTSVAEGSSTTRYVYAADGARMVSSDPAATTLYLPGFEVRRDKASGAISATREYSWGGAVVASRRTGSPLAWLVSDAQGTQQISVASGNQAVTVRRQDPYGNRRGADPAWPTTKGFVGGDVDPTGLTHLGAREYDSVAGRFISVDPIFSMSDSQTWTGYVYANNSPVTLSDPTGLCWICDRFTDAVHVGVAAVWVPTVTVTFTALGNAAAAVDTIGQVAAPIIDVYTETKGGVTDYAWDLVQDANTYVMGTTTDPTGVRLGWEWITGHGDHDRTLEGDSQFVQTLQRHQGIQTAREKIAALINSGELTVGATYTGHYGLDGSFTESLGKVVSDFTTNQSAAFLGSYDIAATVIGVDPEAGTATVRFTIENNSTINSATHTAPALGGYSPWWDRLIKDPLNAIFGESGPASRKHQTITWEETIDLATGQRVNPPPPPPSPLATLRHMFKWEWLIM